MAVRPWDGGRGSPLAFAALKSAWDACGARRRRRGAHGQRDRRAPTSGRRKGFKAPASARTLGAAAYNTLSGALLDGTVAALPHGFAFVRLACCWNETCVSRFACSGTSPRLASSKCLLIAGGWSG